MLCELHIVRTIHFENDVWRGILFFAHVSMMQLWMMFCPEVCVIHLAWSPVYSELLLTEGLGPSQNSKFELSNQRKHGGSHALLRRTDPWWTFCPLMPAHSVFLAIVSCDSQIGHSPFKRLFISPSDWYQPFLQMKYLLEKETHIKNEENTLNERNEIFLTLNGLFK